MKGKFVKKTKKLGKRKTKKSMTLAKLVKKVNLLNKVSYTRSFLQSYGSGSISTPYYALNLWNLPSCAQVFGTVGPDYANANSLYWKSCKLDFIIDQSTEYSNVDMSIFIVTLKDCASNLYSKTTGVLTLTNTLDFVQGSNVGQAYVNPKNFNIHYSKRLLIGNNGYSTSISTAVGPRSVKRIIKTISIKKNIVNPIGNASALVVSQDPSQAYYLLIFNNNLSGDLESPLISWNFYNTVYSSS